ncbi:MAG: putative bifunctional diguanylate cyclase/phosphodiesterase [Bdellovibrionales bacterium]
MSAETRKSKFLSFKNSFISSRAQIWRSWTSWRIAAVVFMTIALVQACLLVFATMGEFETRRFKDLRESGRSAILPLLNVNITQILQSPLEQDQVNNLFQATKVSGISVYTLNMMSSNQSRNRLELLAQYGDPLVISLIDTNNLTRTYRSSDGTTYEFIQKINTVSGSYFMVVRMDSSHIQEELFQFVMDTIKIMMLMSLFVTTVLMIALGRWLLEPILFMRENLMEAYKNPESPQIKDSPFDPNDEIGSAIDIAQSLIKQNAANINQIRSAAEDKIHKLAYYDTLTSLPNRTLFLQTLAEKSRLNAEGESSRFGVVTIDLDHFKDVNDSMGHNVGDAILRGVGKRLSSALPESAIVSRSGEDEFAVMMPLTTDINTARDVAERIAAVIKNEPFKVFNETFQIRSSIGVSTFPDDATDPDQVLKNADIALNRAKEEGRDRIKEYSEDFDRAVQARFQMLRDLRDAMEHEELQLYYQPQLDLRSGEIIGAEALLRWWKKDNSKEGSTFISPGEFIPVAEQSGLIVPIGEWVMEKACRTAKSWHDDHNLDIRIAINVSAHQFSQSDICAYTQKTLNAIGINPHKVELEVTESVFMDDIQHTIQTLQNLHAIGVELAIDDFGTGYSSLSYLRQFPIDRLKIDQSFIRNALNDQDDAAIARTIIALGRALNLKVIAEGVETIEHEKFLQDEGCDEVQGFRYCRPIHEDDFLEFALNYNGKLDSFDKS